MTSIHDVAAYCGVSTATVSRALRGLPNVSESTRRMVEAAAAELGYIVSPSASGLSTGRHQAIAVVVPAMDRWFDTRVFEGVDSVLRRADYDTFLINLAAGPNDRERLFHNHLLRKRADAVITLGIDFTPEEREELQSLSKPAMIVGAPVQGIRCVGLDDEAVGTLAMRHLLDLGHRRIAHVGGQTEYGMNQDVGLMRNAAWRRTLAEHGVAAREDWLAMGAFKMPEAKIAALPLLAGPDRPSAVFAGSDEMAFGVLLAAAELGLRVPEDLSVVGIDDHDWSASFGLTTVHQDPFEQGRAAASIIVDELAGRSDSPLTVLGDFHLVVRRSTAPLTAEPAVIARMGVVPVS